jgi:hypothetical protein
METPAVTAHNTTRSTLLRTLAVGTLATLGGLFATRDAAAGQNVHFLIVMDNGSGSGAQAQPYVDMLMEAAKAANGWDAVEGKYATKRKAAKEYIKDKSPQFGIFSLGAFLSMRKDNGLEVLGVAEVDAAGGRKFHLVSNTAKDLAGCKGQKLATNHKDKKFLERVVSGGAFTLKDFELVKTKRPVQTLKAVIKDEAVCALVDNAQLAELGKLEGGTAVKSVWSSADLPGMAVVAFSGTQAADRAKFKTSLGSLCSGEGKSHCDKVGIKSIKPADEGVFASVVQKYGN